VKTDIAVTIKKSKFKGHFQITKRLIRV